MPARRLVAWAACACLLAGPARAEEPAADGAFVVHGQLTYVEQEVGSFHAPYAGPNSLTPDRGRETADATLYLGARLWEGGEGWLTPEVDQGFGLDDTLGLAGFPSGEAYKVGRARPYLRLPRAFLRETVALGGASEPAAGGLTSFAGPQPANRVVVTIGKFGVGDVFDASRYAHDPRGDFLNWAAIDAGTFDYAADAWGFTVGAAVEWYQGPWTARGGVFELSDVPNSPHLEPGGHEFQWIAELEHRHELGGREGRLLVTGYQSRGRMARLEDAIAAAGGGTPDPAAVRRFRTRAGVHLTLDQALGEELGLFARLGGAGGNVETYEFTDIDRTASLGLSLKGARWRRAGDTIGLAAIANQISAERRRYLDAGGLGILIGDGRLPHAGAERIVEGYYSAAVRSGIAVTFDYQFVTNPAYNRDRGPLSVFALRLHAEF
ncbi:MAG: carbohydrate porin [Proteobacteria bacterium]|nr:carbohydrate porin [Pseudomonadota bacterium]